MKKSYSKTELRAMAVAQLEKDQVGEIFATTDGQLFHKEKFARLNAGEDGTVYHFAKEAALQDDAQKPMSVKDLLALIAESQDKAALDQLLAAENNGAKRVTAIKAIEERISKLTE